MNAHEPPDPVVLVDLQERERFDLERGRRIATGAAHAEQRRDIAAGTEQRPLDATGRVGPGDPTRCEELITTTGDAHVRTPVLVRHVGCEARPDRFVVASGERGVVAGDDRGRTVRSHLAELLEPLASVVELVEVVEVEVRDLPSNGPRYHHDRDLERAAVQRPCRRVHDRARSASAARTCCSGCGHQAPAR